MYGNKSKQKIYAPNMLKFELYREAVVLWSAADSSDVTTRCAVQAWANCSILVHLKSHHPVNTRPSPKQISFLRTLLVFSFRLSSLPHITGPGTRAHHSKRQLYFQSDSHLQFPIWWQLDSIRCFCHRTPFASIANDFMVKLPSSWSSSSDYFQLLMRNIMCAFYATGLSVVSSINSKMTYMYFLTHTRNINM